VEVFAFLLIFFVLREQPRTRRPSPQMLKQTARSFKACSRGLARLADTGLLGSPGTVQHTRDQLEQWATHLREQARGSPMVPIGKIWIGDSPLAAKRHRAKRRVVSFLTYYFHTLGCTVPPWRIITQFLIFANLAPSKTTDKDIATYWSNVIRRDDRKKGPQALAPYQGTLLQLYEDLKRQVWSG
jgi:hypothetical protein